ncbi:XRE family transcriptional regulator [Cellulomonas aerilata]|uniref:DNA-binding protein n=1 Tax=Cellulomonas aerilata TaxID=515326 RepID=A0A512DAL9_9CELL|nr:XRE family transcriptional regulator [Cellulomonas aerilata]GEO33533.1 DNA-binding protein [Cellulomonas aerilata]
MQAARHDVLVYVASNLRRLRQAAGLSQSGLAEASGISRRTIINVEAGEANISLSGLDRLAEALGATFADLVTPPTATRTSLDVLAWRGSRPESKASLLGTVPVRAEAQLWSWTLGPGDRYDAEPDPLGWHEIVIVTAGHLRIEREHEVSELTAGEHAIYSSAQRYSYVNAHDGITAFVRNVVS